MHTPGKKSSKSLRLALAACLFLLCAPAFPQSGIVLNPKKLNGIVWAHNYCDGGNGTVATPWTKTGSNCIQAAYNDLPASGVKGGGRIILQCGGIYDLGSADGAVTIDAAGIGYIGGISIEAECPGNHSNGANSVKNDNGAVLLYSGTGAAFKVGNFTGSTYWAEEMRLKGFKLRQNGTAGTGVGLLLRSFRRSVVEDVTVTDFSIGIAMASVTDLNTFNRVRAVDNQSRGFEVGYTTGMAAPNGQCNSNRFTECDALNQATGTGYTNYGMYIHSNSVGNVIRSSQFHNFDTATYAAIFVNGDSSDSNSTVVDSSYFEHNYTAVLHNNPAASGTDTASISVTNNYITQITRYGVNIQSGSTGETRGVVISGNTFQTPTNASPYDNATGVNLGGYVRNSVLTGNVFRIQAPLGYTLTGGNVIDSGYGSIQLNDQLVQVTQRDAGSPGVTIKNTDNANTEASPRLRFISGGASPKTLDLYAASDGSANFTSASGDALTVTPAGIVTALDHFVGAITGNVTGDLTGSVTAGSGKSVVATAGTVRIPNSTSLPGTCTVGDEYMDTDATVGQQFFLCTATDTWTLQGDGGGSVAFSAISGGTNTLATMLVGSGASLNATGTGVIAATSVPGTGVSGNITGTSANVSGTVASDHGGTGFTTYNQGDVIYASAANTLTKLAKDATANRYLANTGTSNGPAWAQIDLGVAASFANTLGVTKGGTGIASGTSGGVPYFSSSTTIAASGLLALDGIVVGGGAGLAPFSSAATADSGGNIVIPTAKTLDIAAHATDGGSLILKEGADDGTNTFTIKVPDAGLTASKTVTLVAATGNLPASAIEDSGTVSKCAHFDANGILVAASGDCATGGGGSGTVTGVGPGCTTGLCYTNATTTSGTVMWVWEGATSDANQFNMNVPADPTAVINWTVPDATTALTFPSGTDTLIGKATTDTLTNKTLNVESTGNVLTTVEKLWLPAAGCNNATAATFWDLPTANAPTPTCVTGSNTQKGTLAFPDSDGAYSAQQTLLLPSDWTGTMDAKIKWMSAITTGDVFWQVSTICVADAETDDPAFNTASTVADTAEGTTLQTNDASITTVTVTGCAAGELMHLKIMRDRTNGSDTLGASSAQLIGVELTLRRAQ